MDKVWRNRSRYSLCAVLTAIIFVIDLLTPRGFAEGTLYVAPILVTLWIPGRGSSIGVAAVCSLLSLGGFLFSQPADVIPISIFNRTMTLMVIWITAVLCQMQKRSWSELMRTKLELEERVEQRTAQLREVNVCLREEIGERSSMEKNLRQSNLQLEQFAHIVSHDLQQPLWGVRTFTELIERRLNAGTLHSSDELFEAIYRSVEQMKSLIRGLLESAKLHAQGQPTARTDCNAVLEQALSNLRAVIEAEDGFVVSEPLPTVRAHDVQLVQVFQNLIGNALKYRRNQPPRIRVEVERVHEFWQFSVSDNGAGIAPEHLENIFTMFHRLNDDGTGAGIGLASCRQIIERHGGEIRATSVPGQGSTFIFTLPVLNEAPRNVPEPDDEHDEFAAPGLPAPEESPAPSREPR